MRFSVLLQHWHLPTQIGEQDTAERLHSKGLRIAYSTFRQWVSEAADVAQALETGSIAE